MGARFMLQKIIAFSHCHGPAVISNWAYALTGYTQEWPQNDKVVNASSRNWSFCQPLALLLVCHDDHVSVFVGLELFNVILTTWCTGMNI